MSIKLNLTLIISFLTIILLITISCKKEHFTLSEDLFEVSYDAGSFTFTITSNTNWMMTTDSWITISPESGNGDSKITVSYTATETPRTSTIWIEWGKEGLF